MYQECSDPMRERLRQEQIGSSLDRLSEALHCESRGREGYWARSLANAFCRVEAVLRERLRAPSEWRGIFAEVDMTVSALAHQASDVCQAERDLLSDIEALRAELERAHQALDHGAQARNGQADQQTGEGDSPDLESLRCRAEYLLTVLQAVGIAEIELILEGSRDISTHWDFSID